MVPEGQIPRRDHRQDTLDAAPMLRTWSTKARAARIVLRPVLASHLPLRTKLCVYKAIVRTRLTYAAPAWFALTSETGRKSLRTQQSLTLRTLFGAPRYVRNQVISRDLRMESLDDFVIGFI
ncbi:unnamed protein product [Leptidea sinapis]|uniref:RNA-directed DNA polymerase from mobile element jockey n=1 Tax=Leptidea sinapis TaxID=189913 RepID=A0A5E4QU30_9NEOP|nr:unnamed protein product [Leptidea sinapis]